MSAGQVMKWLKDENEDPEPLLLHRFKDGIEYPIPVDEGYASKIFVAYEALLYRDVNIPSEDSVLNCTLGGISPSGAVVILFWRDFPASSHPMTGGLSEFKFDDFEFRFESEGAMVAFTIIKAHELHKVEACKPWLCPDPQCPYYSSALDEHMFLFHESAFFARYCPPLSQKSYNNFPLPHGATKITLTELNTSQDSDEPQSASIVKVVPVNMDEYLIEVAPPAALTRTHGQVDILGTRWEVMPVPSDASHLDVHLAHMSSIDSRYVTRFTEEVKNLFNEPPDFGASTQHGDGAYGSDEQDEDEAGDEDDDEDSYVESSLVPGLRRRDFNRAIDAPMALAGLSLDSETEERLKEILA